MWYFTFAANNRLLRKNTTFSLYKFSKLILKFFYHCVCVENEQVNFSVCIVKLYSVILYFFNL